jgi:O-antigen/teichoic acid export membrane protein
MTPVLTLLCMGVVWYSVGYPAGYTLIARGHTKGLLAGAATSAVLNVSLDIVLIPLTGPIGAGAATFVAFVAGTLVWMHAHEMLHGWGLRTVAALTIVTLGGFAVLLIPALRVPVGALTFFTAVVFGCVGLDRMGPKGRYGSARLRSLLR